MKHKLYFAISMLATLTIILSSLGVSPAKAEAKQDGANSPTNVGWAVVVVRVATVIAALPVIATGWDWATCRYETSNVRQSTSRSQDFGTFNYYNSRTSYSYTSPGQNFPVSRDGAMNGVLNDGVNNAIRSKTGVDVLSGNKYVSPQTFTFNTGRSVKQAYATVTFTKYTFDVYKRCGFWSNSLVLGSTWFIAPSQIVGKYAYMY